MEPLVRVPLVMEQDAISVFSTSDRRSQPWLHLNHLGSFHNYGALGLHSSLPRASTLIGLGIQILRAPRRFSCAAKEGSL